MIAGVSITTLLLVLVAGIGAGFVGYAVGASSLISYPALLAFGIPPVLSNTTNTVGVCGTGIGGLLSARKELKGQGRRVAVYACIGLVGGIIGGLLLGCTRSVASKFTFFLAIPVMFGASALKLVKYFVKGGTFGTNEIAILGVGCIVAFVVSLIAIKWLMGFVRRHDFKCFGVYRIILGIVVLAYFFVLEPMLGL